MLGAYDGDRMIGFCLGIPGIKPGNRPYLHSHMLGVLAGISQPGRGPPLKLRQREDALARGIPLIEWTFDPLELKNAFFNIERLGAIVRRYSVNQYGITGSPLHGGLPTDRCYAEWWIDSPRVRAHSRRASGRNLDGRAHRFPRRYRAHSRREEPPRARRIQQENAEKFQGAFARGLAVTGFYAQRVRRHLLIGAME